MITLQINGQLRNVDVPSDTPLLWTLRDALGLTGRGRGHHSGGCPSTAMSSWGRGPDEPLRVAL
jgi:isoquinoline 1-oxidoreductase subunit alpha